MSKSYTESIFLSIRQIIRATDLYSRKVKKQYNLTIPQVVCLRQILENQPITPSSLADEAFLSRATITGILDRLELRGLVERQRTGKDRRKVFIVLTQQGKELTANLPAPLQDRFSEHFEKLKLEEQKNIDQVLGLVVEMMNAQDVEVTTEVAAGF